MAVQTRIKQCIKRCSVGLYLTERYKKYRYEKRLKQMDDRAFIEWLYTKRNGVKPNLDAPQSFTEKLQWLKLFYRDPRMTRCADKYELKNYLAEQGLGALAIPTLALYESVDEVTPAELPERCILKATHGSGWHVRLDSDGKRSWRRMKCVMKVWLSESLYIFGREWNYREQVPRLMAEPLLSDHPTDYKFFCFGGTVRAIQVNQTAEEPMTVDFYDTAWTRLEGVNTAGYPNAEKATEKPLCFDEMRRVAERLSEPFPFVRVDMYCIDGRMYVGEMTFFPSGGFYTIKPSSWEERFGEWLYLPPKKDTEG